LRIVSYKNYAKDYGLSLSEMPSEYYRRNVYKDLGVPEKDYEKFLWKNAAQLFKLGVTNDG
jgi:hypothetical protein